MSQDYIVIMWSEKDTVKAEFSSLYRRGGGHYRKREGTGFKDSRPIVQKASPPVSKTNVFMPGYGLQKYWHCSHFIFVSRASVSECVKQQGFIKTFIPKMSVMPSGFKL